MNFHKLQTAVYYNTLSCKRCLVSLQWNALTAGRTYFLTVYILTGFYPLGNVENFPRIKRTEREAFLLNANSIQVHNAYSYLRMPKIIARKSIIRN